MLLTHTDLVQAVRIARASIEINLGRKNIPFPEIPDVFDRKSGVFVTLNRYPGKELRGCIGFPEPIMELKKAIPEAAISAATKDPRFPKVTVEEMDDIIIDVTVLTPPEKIRYESPEELPSLINIGEDGLIARKGFMSGLLLPQVPVEWGWNAEEFLSHTCLKAGMTPDEWKRGTVSFEKFSGRVFGEKSPRGEIVEEELT